MLDTEPTGAGNEAAATDEQTTTTTRPRRRRAASRPAGPPKAADATEAAAEASADASPATADAEAKPKRRRATKKAAAPKAAESSDPAPPADDVPAPAAKRTRKRAARSAEPADTAAVAAVATAEPATPAAEPAAATTQGVGPLFQAPEPVAAQTRRQRAAAVDTDSDAETTESDEDTEAPTDEDRPRSRRRGGRGRRGRGRGSAGEDEATAGAEAEAEADQAAAEQTAAKPEPAGTPEEAEDEAGSRRRRRRRRRSGADAEDEVSTDDPPNTVVRVRAPRPAAKSTRSTDDDVRSLKGSTRLEAKKQRRREGRETGRRRPSIITEAEFLARRESVDRVMVVRQTGERTQIAVLEDGVLAEHYVSTASSTGLVGNVYLGRVQNVLPAMEAAFVDVGKGRNAVLYAGEVNWDAAGLDGQPKRIEQALKSGDSVLVQVTKDPIGHKGARLTSQVSLPGRYLVYVPGGSMTGISRKLPDTERTRLKSILKQVLPEDAGVIVRTAAEGASEQELSRDVARLSAQWDDIEKKAKTASAPAMLYGEPDLTIRVVRDIFNEDFAKLIVSGGDAWETLEPYVGHIAPDLKDRLTRWTDEEDAFAAHRVDEQLAKALDRKVWLPSGGYLVIDRTEAMVVIDVNTGKFTGQGGNLEETVTKNNIEAAEEIVRQMRLRDLGGIIVIDFIDMVLESNRDLVLRRLLECLGRDRTKHQVAEVTSLGLVQMTRKRVGQGLLEAFSETCEHCNGRGYHVHTEPVVSRSNGSSGSDRRGGARKATAKRTRGKAKDAPADEAGPAADEVEALPAALEDPVEPPTVGSEDVEETPIVTPARRRRRKATSTA